MANTVWHLLCCSVELLFEQPQQWVKEWECTNGLGKQLALWPRLNVLPETFLKLLLCLAVRKFFSRLVYICFFPFAVLIDILSPIPNQDRHIWPFRSLTILIIWLFCCSALLLFFFCQYILRNEMFRVNIVVCMCSHDSSTQRKGTPSLLQATPHTQKMAEGRLQGH